jgi:uncharacterized protein
MTHPHHAIDYVEITVPDLEVAKAFYADAFGWQFTDYGPDYCGIAGPGESEEEREQGGLCRGEPARRGGPLVILYSADLDSSLAAVIAAGGEIVDPITAFPGGRRFRFTDPAGNELAVWSAS